LGSQENTFSDGVIVVASDPGSYVVPYLIGIAVGARMYRVSPDGPFVDWPWWR
jgi:hypothetical protein